MHSRMHVVYDWSEKYTDKPKMKVKVSFNFLHGFQKTLVYFIMALMCNTSTAT